MEKGDRRHGGLEQRTDGHELRRESRPAPDDPASVHDIAAAGVSGSGGTLPHFDRIQEAFGGAHDLGQVRAHVGGAAAAASEQIGASAYATGEDIAFGTQPDLHTAAHEAAHVVQQRAGVQLPRGVGTPGDAYERQADAVADRVVQGRPAEDLLGTMAAPSRTAGPQQESASHGKGSHASTRAAAGIVQAVPVSVVAGVAPRPAAGGVASWFQSDWAGQAILARYLTGGGDWDIANDRWSAYMRANASLRRKLAKHARHIITNVNALGYEEGVVSVHEQFPVSIENGEGIIGYQYLHGTNADVGGFEIHGSAYMIPGPPAADMTSDVRRVRYSLEYRWNDMIDPNPQYGTDTFKAAIADAISAGMAASYRISITWSGEGIATIGPSGGIASVATTSDTGEALNGYPLR